MYCQVCGHQLIKKKCGIDGEVPYFYHGYTIPEDYLNIVRQLMERDIKKGLIKRHDNSRSE